LKPFGEGLHQTHWVESLELIHVVFFFGRVIELSANVVPARNESANEMLALALERLRDRQKSEEIGNPAP
jgi:hypothetical protein